MMRKCIFYLPYELEEHGKGARMLRPRKMIQAFRDIGYDVDVVAGFSKERRNLIKQIKENISKGTKYDFMYAESHSEPTLLTDPGHLPTHPFLDFGFYRYIRSCGIPIGMFYCDVYWKFEAYGEGLSAWRKQGALLCYRYDLRQYEKYLNRFYVPDMKMCDYIQDEKLTAIAGELPPGADAIEVKEEPDHQIRDFDQKPLTLFYVGGLGKHYQIIDLVKAVRENRKTQLTICCREAEWEKEKAEYEAYMCDRIHVIHKSSDELEPYYSEADICSLVFKNDVYREFAKPFKAYEYLAHEKPVLSTKGTGIGRFVEENDIGWNIEFNADTISETLKDIIANPSVLEEKREHCRTTKEQNLWTSRAKQVEQELIN